MANMYLGGSNPYAGMFGGGASNPLRPGQENPLQSAAPRGATPTPPIRPGQETPQPTSPIATPPGNVLGAQTVRPSGASQGFDPAYLQNLATAIGGQFSRPQGNLSFNPLGNLQDISGPSGLPNTWLQDALNGLGFAFQPPTSTTSTTSNVGNRGNNNGFGGRGPRQVLD